VAEGNRSGACDDSQLAPSFGDIDDELQRSIGDEIRLRGGGTTWCLLGAAGSPMERR
jgi:hypothetical protein